MRVLCDRTIEKLPCALTDDEFVARAGALARICQDIEGEVDRQKQIKSAMNAEMARLEAQRAVLSLVVARKSEVRDVGVCLLADDNSGMAVTVREDTAEVVRKRPLEPAERQLTLPTE